MLCQTSVLDQCACILPVDIHFVFYELIFFSMERHTVSKITKRFTEHIRGKNKFKGGEFSESKGSKFLKDYCYPGISFLFLTFQK